MWTVEGCNPLHIAFRTYSQVACETGGFMLINTDINGAYLQVPFCAVKENVNTQSICVYIVGFTTMYFILVLFTCTKIISYGLQ